MNYTFESSKLWGFGVLGNDLGEGLSVSILVLLESLSRSLVSLDHHRNGNIVVVSWVLLLSSVLLEDGLESVVSNYFSERLESHRLDVIQTESWRNFDSDSLDLVNWNLGNLGSSVGISILGSDERSAGWSSG